MVVSKRFEIKKEDLLRVGKNSLIFAGPALLVLGASFIEVVPANYKYAAGLLWGLNALLDLLRKFLSENKYK